MIPTRSAAPVSAQLAVKLDLRRRQNLDRAEMIAETGRTQLALELRNLVCGGRQALRCDGALPKMAV
jgi:hypothetical protein